MLVSLIVTSLFSLATVSAQNSNASVPIPSNLPESTVGNATIPTITSSNQTESSNSTTSKPITPPTNPLIPTSISSGCKSFLQTMNSDSALSACTTPLISALELFTPSTTSDSTFSASESSVLQGLSSLCKAAKCSDNMIRDTLMGFSGNCSAELQSGNAAVLGSYDVLYILSPFTDAVCSKDGSGGFCLTSISNGTIPTSNANVTASNLTMTNPSVANSTVSNSTGTNLAVATQYHLGSYVEVAMHPLNLFIQMGNTAGQVTRRLLRRGPEDLAVNGTKASNATMTNSTTSAPLNVTAPINSTAPVYSLLPNATTFRTTSLPFLFLDPSMSSNLLCTSCTKNILASYVAWESKIPYALGLSNSPLLGGQGTLWTGIGGICGGGFLESIAVVAGQQALNSGSEKMVLGFSGLIGLTLMMIL